MINLFGYATTMHVVITILPHESGEYARFEVRDPDTGFFERCIISEDIANDAMDIDDYIMRRLDSMTARIGSRKATLYASRHASHKRRELEEFWKRSTPIYTEGTT